MPCLYIALGNAPEHILQFNVLPTPIAELWLERMQARLPYPMDHSNRFYGFDSAKQNQTKAEDWIKKCVYTINSYVKIIHRPFTNAQDQDFLNYLHNIFEHYHGLLDNQNNEFWHAAPAQVKQALADLNLAIHACESLRGLYPRFVCTWFGLPKDKKLSLDLMKEYGTVNASFGTVYLNYVEIGKTFEELCYDQDNYISAEAFIPFTHYSADFNVKFYELTNQQIQDRQLRMQIFYNTRKEFFVKQGYSNFTDVRLQPLMFPVAQLVEQMPRDKLLYTIAQMQNITQVWIE